MANGITMVDGEEWYASIVFRKKKSRERLRLASAAELQNFRSVPLMETAASRVMVKPTLP
jgi:hypothetical protein